MEILNYLLASKRAQTPTLSHSDLLILSVFRGLITVCKSCSPAALNACIVTSPRPPLWPPRPSWGVRTHLSNSVCPNISPYIHQNPLEFIGNTHTNTGTAETASPLRVDFHIRSRLKGRSVETRSANSLLLLSFFFWFFDIPFLYICIIQSFLPIKDFQWAFLSDSLPEMFFHHNKRLKEPEKREKSYAVWLQVFCRVSVLQCCRTLVSILERLFGRNATVFVDTLSFWAWRVQKEESDVHASVVLSSMELWRHRPVQFSPLLAFI